MSKMLFDMLPLIIFFAAFKIYGIYAATAVAIVASICQVGWLKFRGSRIEATHWITLGVILVFGGLTLVLRNDAFIKWKPTIVNWAFAVILLFTQFASRKTAVEYLLGKQFSLPVNVWRNMNLSWALFFVVVGVLNLYVAFWYGADRPMEERTATWVNFKVFGLMALTFLFMVGQMLLIVKHIEEPDDADDAAEVETDKHNDASVTSNSTTSSENSK